MFGLPHLGHEISPTSRAGAVAVLAALAVSCAGGANGKGLLPPPATTPAAMAAADAPTQGFEAQADGTMVRRVYRADADGPVAADILDVLVPPGKSTILKHAGVVVVETREGSPAATLVEKSLALDTGTTFGLAQGDTARVDNRGKEPLLLRVYLVSLR